MLPSRCVQTAIGLVYLIPMWATGMQKVPKLTKDDVMKVREAFVAYREAFVAFCTTNG